MKKLFTLIAFMAIATLASFAQEQLTIQIKASDYVMFNDQKVKDFLKLNGENANAVDMTKESELKGQNVYHYSIELNPGTYQAFLAGTTSSGTDITGGNVYKPSFTLTSTQTVHFWGLVPSNKSFVQGLCSAMQYGVMDSNWQYYAMGKPSYNNTTATGYFFTPAETILKSLKGGVSTKVLKDDILTSSGNGVLPVTIQSDSYTASVGLKKFEFDYATWTMTVSDATTMDVVITDAKASTLCAPVALTIPAGVKAYTLTYDGSTTLVATEVTNTIPASTPVLLNANAGTYSFAVGAVASEIGTTTTSNSKSYMKTVSEGNLCGVFQEKYVPQDAYVLQNGDSGVGFYQVNVNNYAINAFRCYVSLPAPASSSLRIVFPEDCVTGISTVATAADNVVYNLQGQRVDATKAGVYVKNGKKFIVK